MNYNHVNYRPDYVPANWVFGLYDSNDLRPETIFQTLQTGFSHGLSWPLLIKYAGNNEFIAANILHVSMPKVLRLSEQYLIRAEAYVQQAQPDYGRAGKILRLSVQHVIQLTVVLLLCLLPMQWKLSKQSV